MERVDIFTSNPTRVSPEALEKLDEFIEKDDSFSSYETWKEHKWAYILHPEYYFFRLGNYGWRLKIQEGIQDIEGNVVEEITSLGPDQKMGTLDYMNADSTITGLVGGAFTIQSQLDSSAPPKVNKKMKGVNIIEEKYLEEVSAPREGVFMVSRNKLSEQWQRENPDLYNYIHEYIEIATEVLTEKTIRYYENVLSPDSQKSILNEVTKQWREVLEDCAFRAYAMFTPNPPELIPVPLNN